MTDRASSTPPEGDNNDPDESSLEKQGRPNPNDHRDHEQEATTTTSKNADPQTPSSCQHAAQLSLDDVYPVHVQIRDLGVSVDTSPSWLEPSTYGQLVKEGLRTNLSSKPLLRHVSASLAPGTLTAIIGGSGSGKTTLLNTLAGRTSSNRLSQTGSATFNGQSVSNVRSAYVMQQDILLASLGVRETLQYAARLRLPPETDQSTQMRVVEEVILELGLKECADTRIGSSRHKGCSGGEKRRTSIGVQMLSNPSVLFLDEPTTGLDSASAFQLVRTLESLARKGRTVITTIHQPRSEIWRLFDNAIVLSRGRPVYSGPRDGCAPWMASRGFRLPDFVNPAEFFIDVAAIDTRTPELERETHSRVENLHAAWREQNDTRRSLHAAEKPANPQRPTTAGRARRLSLKRAPLLRQVQVLTSRTFKTTYRDPLGMSAVLAEAALMGIVAGYIFFDLARDQSGIRSRQGALYIAAGLQGYLVLLLEVFRLTVDIQTFDREHGEGCVSAAAFVLSRRLARLFTEDVAAPFVFSAIYYFMVGFERTAERFFTFFAVTLLGQYIAVTCAMTCIAAVRHFAGASLIANLSFTIQSIACGMFVQSNSIPVYVRWIKYITYTYYIFGAYAANEFAGNFYACPFEGGRANQACVSYTGEYVMGALGFPDGWITRPMIVLVAFMLFFVILSAAGLSLRRVDMAMARSRVSETDLSAGKEKMADDDARQEVRSVGVGLEGFSLVLDRRSWVGRKATSKMILSPVTTSFQAGVLNVIMGPSGSGKTSLLNSMALRLRSTVTTRYRPCGKLTFNGAVPSRSVIRSVCSYVCQDDDALLPSLTVRETLRFAAGLRLPSFMNKEDKRQRADEVLLQMGLKDCADTAIGNELVKGISGGEKRRVSIAVQILTNPRVLLLDEPTSGLDAFTANSIMEVLRGLAQEGRTIIVAIHQARSDLFRHFGNVLLLARGGRPAYSGRAAEMVRYFSGLGLECPKQTNPADFVLDMITIDLQEESRELRSRETVQKIVEAWRQRDETAFGTRHAEQGSLSLGGGAKATLHAPAQLGVLRRASTPLHISMPLLLRRALVNTRRQPEQILARTMQVIGLGIILALFFAPLPDDSQAGVQNRMGLLQQVGALYFVGMLQNVAIYPAERDVFYREHDDGVYGVDAFLATYSLLEFPFEVVSGLVFAVLAVLAIGLPRTAEVFFVMAFACFGIVSCGESLGIMFNTFFDDHTGFAISIMSVVLSIASCMAGVLSTNMPAIFDALNYLSPIRYGIHALAPFMMAPVRFECAEADQLPGNMGGRCPIETGDDVLRLYNFGGLDDGTVNIAALAACVVVYRLVAWAVLRTARGRWGEKLSDRKRNLGQMGYEV